MTMTERDPLAPMAAAPLKYRADGAVDWGDMWDSFCALAQEGGPPHRSERDGIAAPAEVNPEHPNYQVVVDELCRGIQAVSRLSATPAEPGWIAVDCTQPGMAAWLAEAIQQENVVAREYHDRVYVPVAETYTITAEIKSVITVVAKTTHYWNDHLPVEVKRTFALHARLAQAGRRVKRWLKR